MRKNSRHKALWDYLEKSGVLVHGSDADIKRVKNEYRKKYLLEFKRKQRSNKPEYTVNFSKQKGDYSKIAQAAKEHNIPITGFIHSAVFAYLDRTYIVPNKEQVAKLEQTLAECLNEIKAFVQTREKRFWEREQKLEDIESKIIKMEKQINEIFRYPAIRADYDYQNKIS